MYTVCTLSCSFTTYQFLEVLFNVFFSIISILDGHVGTAAPDASLLAPPTSSKLDHVLTVLALTTVRQLACLTHTTASSLGSRTCLTINLMKEEMLIYVPH